MKFLNGAILGQKYTMKVIKMANGIAIKANLIVLRIF